MVFIILRCINFSLGNLGFKRMNSRPCYGTFSFSTSYFTFLMRYFSLFSKIDSGKIDTNDDRRIDLAEFKSGAKKVGLSLPAVALEREFASLDQNHGGFVLFGMIDTQM